jgi:hypothetical protein
MGNGWDTFTKIIKESNGKYNTFTKNKVSKESRTHSQKLIRSLMESGTHAQKLRSLMGSGTHSKKIVT